MPPKKKKKAPAPAPVVEEELPSSYVIHLKVHTNQLTDINGETNFNDTAYGAVPYDPANLENYYLESFSKPSVAELVPSSEPPPMELVAPTHYHQDFYFNMIKLAEQNKVMVDFEYAKYNGWPSKTDIACMWCCHEFATPPVGIPKKMLDGKFYLAGCYCSYNCAAADILAGQDSSKWSYYSLLHLMFKTIHGTSSDITIRPAPSKNTLKKFGGIYTIEQYRENLNTNQNNVKILFPPLIFIAPKVYEYNFKKEIDNQAFMFRDDDSSIF